MSMYGGGGHGRERPRGKSVGMPKLPSLTWEENVAGRVVPTQTLVLPPPAV